MRAWIVLSLLLLVGSLAFLIFLITVSLIARNSPCKNSSTCPVYQTCDAHRGLCVSLPGYRCSSNSQCSAFAPICQPHDHYCTNTSSQGRGTSGNPPHEGNGPKCDGNLILNTAVNLCQQTSIGSPCVMDAQCNQGICHEETRTCQYATTECTTDTALNPNQCAPPNQCDHASLRCAVPGTTPGGDGSPCNTNADCANGSVCISGPSGAGFGGVCRSGHATWLMILADPQAGEDVQCMTPLVGRDGGWCRYDIERFMECDKISECQYPYSECSSHLPVCVLPFGVVDPIDVAMAPAPGKQLYDPVGVNVGGIQVKGLFFAATYPLTPAESDNATGGKLLLPYTGFLQGANQFAGQPGFNDLNLVTFSRVTSFCVISMAAVRTPPAPPQLPYHTAVFQDPIPILVLSSIIPLVSSPGQSALFFTLYSQLNTTGNKFLAGIGFQFSSVGAVMWNPASIRQANPSLQGVSFVPNPIVTPWISVVPSGSVQASCIHSLILVDGCYQIGVYTDLLDIQTFGYASTIVIPVLPPNPAGVSERLTPDNFLIVAWDAMSIEGPDAPPFKIINTTILLYGLLAGQYTLFVCQISFLLALFAFIPVGGSNQVPGVFASLDETIRSHTTQCRLSRAAQSAEPLLIMTCFSEAATGLLLSSFAMASTNANVNFDTSKLAKSQTLEGVAAVFYVTPVTGAYNYGSFVVWCATAQTRLAFLVVQINAGSSSPSDFWMTPIFSAVYWRRLTGELVDTYNLYPVGGGSVPYFLATDIPLTFDGTPF